ncbi:MAG TPA: DUF3014 domain-containing protein, partial [Pseudorhodoferax sp.]|nr:DUF3014 domain-containing protein [Pseudorhodoferax sp.]
MPAPDPRDLRPPQAPARIWPRMLLAVALGAAVAWWFWEPAPGPAPIDRPADIAPPAPVASAPPPAAATSSPQHPIDAPRAALPALADA